ncbi:M14 metallopeptidase family protein [Flavobacterium sp. '19STA2R22 D10 B1']|uniref:M14 family metallopeptidase n=1 Tax=Flavobacterium aerium TaxID=3037261 RepID=UPI00278C82A8|nr:M14 metallopeptidase family protein [Flavobacterium sp. '19STA2R22 D10 B1']
MNFDTLFEANKESSLQGRYITLDHIEPLIERIKKQGTVSIEGYSVENRPIYVCKLGTGQTKLYMWSQMHGNEGTTTKALFDLIHLLLDQSEFSKKILNNFTFCIIPMLNPDGSALYTRENANKVDLNRDSFSLSQPESKVLREVFESFWPDYCFNLHDQRTIFAAGDTNKPATVSFLSPSYNEARDVNEVRLKAMNIIVAMNTELQRYIPGQVGRFDDSFNINCIGDMFQFLGVPTVLFEAGHYENDYEREITRKYIFIALVSALSNVYENVIVDNKMNDYLNIPQNKAKFYDFIYKNVKISYDGKQIITNFAAQYKEVLNLGLVGFEARIQEIGELDGYVGHFEYDAEGAEYADESKNYPEINQKADFLLGNKIKVTNGMLKF